MAWDYTAEVSGSTVDENGYPSIQGIKITKHFIDDSGNSLVSVETDALDAALNAGPGFADEYRLAAYQILSSQLDSILNSQEHSLETLNPQLGGLFGHQFRVCISTLNTLLSSREEA